MQEKALLNDFTLE